MVLANSAVEDHHQVEGSHENPNIGNKFIFRNSTTNYHGQQHQQQISESVINFKYGIDNIFQRTNNHESLLSFEAQQGGIWDDDNMEDPNCFQSTTLPKQNKNHHGNYNNNNNSHVYDQWLYNEDHHHVQAAAPLHEIPNHKRSHTGESSGGVCKKQCTSSTTANKKQKTKSSIAKDPQSIAAKNRRERISERLKILQELVPNGSKVDLVTMLEKAISYVKFLQVQVKILATDEFWPVQGGKAPDISQVKEAIDAILSSQRERSSSSNSEK